jgi:Cu2+-exporting ATPase
MFGALAMSLSSFCVVSNALRLNFVNLSKPAKPKKRKNNISVTEITVAEEKGEKAMKKTMKIEGMMCPHCSGRVKGALEALLGVESADVSHERGDAVVVHSQSITRQDLENVITEAGYKVVG